MNNEHMKNIFISNNEFEIKIFFQKMKNYCTYLYGIIYN